MYYFIAFVVGAILGGIVTFFIVANNQKKALAAMNLTKEQLDKVKGGK